MCWGKGTRNEDAAVLRVHHTPPPCFSPALDTTDQFHCIALRDYDTTQLEHGMMTRAAGACCTRGDASR